MVKDFVGQVFIVIDDNSSKWDDGIERWKVVPDNDCGRTKGVSYIKKTLN
jgi:hypothetical protein